MITKGSDYDQTRAFGDTIAFPPKGGYVCRILSAEEKNSKNGKPMVHIAFDIIEGEYKDFFMNLFKRRKDDSENPSEVKYPFEGQSWVMVNDYEDPSKTSSKFKGFCTALEESGTVVWNGDTFMTGNLKGAEVGIIFQNTESEYKDKRTWRALPWAFRSKQKIIDGDFTVPKDKALPAEEVSPVQGFSELQDQLDEIPF